MENEILAIIAKVSDVEPGDLKPETELVADLQLDSPAALTLICDLEDKLNIQLPDEAFDNMETVGDVLRMALSGTVESDS